MKYYIVVDEWNYPTESGRGVVGDYDTFEQAFKAAEEEFNMEYDNFLEVNNGELYSKACGKVTKSSSDPKEFYGYMLCSSPNESENMYFKSKIIEIDD